MSEQEMKRQSLYDLLNADTKPKKFLSTLNKAKKINLQKKRFLRKKVNGGLNKRQKERF